MAGSEKHVIDAIDALVNEQLDGGPHDDYNRNYYPQCSCGHDWHGVECEWCSCTSTETAGQLRAIRPLTPRRRELDVSVLTGDGVPYSELEEEWRRREGAVVHDRLEALQQGAPWVVYHEEEREGFESVGTPGGGGGRIPEGFVPMGFLSDEEADQLDAVVGEFNRSIDQHAHEHVHRLDGSGRCVWADCPGPGYTMADVERMRIRQPWNPYVNQISSIRQDYPQRYILGQQGRPRIRFWRYLAEEARFWLIEGQAEVMHITWGRDGVTVEVKLEDYGELVVNEEDTHLRPASTPIPPGMIAMEGFTPEGEFTTVGYLNPDDLTIDHTRDYGFDSERSRLHALQEEYRVTMRIPDDHRSLLDRLQGQ